MPDNKFHKAFKEANEKYDFHPLNEVKIFIFLEKLIKRESSTEAPNIDEMVQIIKKLLLEGRQPSLNPCVDELWEINKNDVDDGLKKMIEERMTFLVSEIDKNMNHLKLSFTLDIVFGNLDPFIESKELKIEKIEVQTPFYRKIIEG